jgi:antitoxin MazE
MVTTVQKWGNSQGLRLAKSVLQDAHIGIGDEVDVVVRDGTIVVAPARRKRGRHRLEDLVARIPADYRPAEVDWGKPRGKEAKHPAPGRSG